MTKADGGKQRNNQPTTGDAKAGGGGGGNGDSTAVAVAAVDDRDR
jgi:hypothetical protein